MLNGPIMNGLYCGFDSGSTAFQIAATSACRSGGQIASAASAIRAAWSCTIFTRSSMSSQFPTFASHASAMSAIALILSRREPTCASVIIVLLLFVCVLKNPVLTGLQAG